MLGFLAGAAAMFAVMYSTQAILPEIGGHYGVTPARAGLTVSALVLAIIPGTWLWGPLSDRIGRRRTLILSSALLVPVSLAVAAAPGFGWLVALRALQGLVMPGLLAGGVLGFLRAMGDFGATLMVAGNIPGRTQTMAMAIYDRVQANDTAGANQLAVILTSIGFGLLFLVIRLRERGSANA